MTIREQAKSQGLKRYDMPKPCKRGHLGQRYTSTGICCECDLLAQKARRDKDPETNRRRVKRWQKKNPDKHNAKSRRWYAENTEQHSETVSDWQKRNPDKKRAIDAAYRARRLQALPPWADLKAIEAFYSKCPEGHEVDHIYPLKHELISGLHVLENLQYLTISENRQKSNHWPYPN